MPISFSFATWRIQSFLWSLPAGLSWYLSRDLLGYLILCSLQCRKPVGHLCCKLYCFLFLEFLEIQRRNAVQSLSFSQPDFERRLVTSGCNCLRAPEPFFRYFVFRPCSVSLSIYLPFPFFFFDSFLASSSVLPSAFSHCISFLTISSAFSRTKRRKGHYMLLAFASYSCNLLLIITRYCM